jgi:hypothetical protein
MDKDARVGYAEREQAIDRLQHHCSLGRLGLDELAERTARAQAASTRGELDALLADLPDEEPRPSRRTSPAWRTHAMVAALFTAALTGLWFLTRDPTPGPPTKASDTGGRSGSPSCGACCSCCTTWSRSDGCG